MTLHRDPLDPARGAALPRRTVLRGAAAAWAVGGLPWSLQVMAQAQAAAPAVPAEVSSNLPQAKLQGSGRLTFLGLHVYDARLWVSEGFRAEDYARQPLALELEYARTLYGKLIAERSVTEMKKIADVSANQAQAWQAEMTRLFPDVNKGDRITGLQRPGESTRFFVNGSARGEVRDADFTPLFFGIWLSPRTSEPKLRQALVAGGMLAR